MKKISIAICATVMALCACDNTPKFCVEGNITNAKDSMLYLVATRLDKIEIVDSIKLGDNGHFCFKPDAVKGPEFYSLIMNNHSIDLVIDSTETVKITADSKTMDSEYKVEGSVCTEHIREIVSKRHELEKNIIEVTKNNSLYPKEITDSIASMIDKHKNWLVSNYIRKLTEQACSYYALSEKIGQVPIFAPYDKREDSKHFATVANVWQMKRPDSPRTKKLVDEATKAMAHTAPKPEKVLEIDPEIVSETGIIGVELPDANGTLHNIKDLKGKIVMLDFTIYDSDESGLRNINLRTLYDKYNAQGFEIYQISLDENINLWKNSIEKLPWICVHETNGTVTSSYGVQKVPTFFLVNRSNEIVVRSDFMEGSLEENIKKLL